ncbi:hypothetical protein B9Z55_029107 [Caenorhabditis nigoni]|uniref:Uncharacterized protein n=1 Tax=Caenorhabditis nigoni TaxID=1611254 RepID=A0A2G5S8R6_9PELO|nr:hypothetical protein B9Z55_029107 [Caenorhabditis nigoni]
MISDRNYFRHHHRTVNCNTRVRLVDFHVETFLILWSINMLIFSVNAMIYQVMITDRTLKPRSKNTKAKITVETIYREKITEGYRRNLSRSEVLLYSGNCHWFLTFQSYSARGERVQSNFVQGQLII